MTTSLLAFYSTDLLNWLNYIIERIRVTTYRLSQIGQAHRWL